VSSELSVPDSFLQDLEGHEHHAQVHGYIDAPLRRFCTKARYCSISASTDEHLSFSVANCRLNAATESSASFLSSFSRSSSIRFNNQHQHAILPKNEHTRHKLNLSQFALIRLILHRLRLIQYPLLFLRLVVSPFRDGGHRAVLIVCHGFQEVTR